MIRTLTALLAVGALNACCMGAVTITADLDFVFDDNSGSYLDANGSGIAMMITGVYVAAPTNGVAAPGFLLDDTNNVQFSFTAPAGCICTISEIDIDIEKSSTGGAGGNFTFDVLDGTTVLADSVNVSAGMGSNVVATLTAGDPYTLKREGLSTDNGIADFAIFQGVEVAQANVMCSAVPEPSAFLFLGSLATLGAFGRWRKRHSS